MQYFSNRIPRLCRVLSYVGLLLSCGCRSLIDNCSTIPAFEERIIERELDHGRLSFITPLSQRALAVGRSVYYCGYLLSAEIDPTFCVPNRITLICRINGEHPFPVEAVLDAKGNEIVFTKKTSIVSSRRDLIIQNDIYLKFTFEQLHLSKDALSLRFIDDNNNELAINIDSDDVVSFIRVVRRRLPLDLQADIATGNLAELKESLRNKKIAETDRSRLVHIAAENGHLEQLKELVKFGYALDAKDEDGRTPLHLAAGEGHISIINYLLDRGVSPKTADRWDLLPIHYAWKGNYEECARKLEDNVKVPLWRFTCAISKEVQQYLRVRGASYINGSKQKFEHCILIINEPHGNSVAQKNLLLGLEILFRDNPGLIPETIFLSEGVDHGTELNIDALRKAKSDPSASLVNIILESFLIPASAAVEWKNFYGIPISGIEDSELYNLSARLGLINENYLWQRSVVARNRRMADAVSDAAGGYYNPILFCGFLHLSSIESDVFESSLTNSSINSITNIFVGSKGSIDTRLLVKIDNLGVVDYLHKRGIGYTALEAIGEADKAKLNAESVRYKQLFTLQETNDYSGYIEKFIKDNRKGGVTVRPAPEAAAQLILAMAPANSQPPASQPSQNNEKGGDKGNDNTKENKPKNNNDPDWLKDPESIKGKPAEEVEAGIPESWEGPSPTSSNGGKKWFKPGTGQSDVIRIMPGDGDAKSSPDHQGPYAKISHHGKTTHVPLKGNPALK